MGYLSGRIAAARGLQLEEVPVGFKYVAEKMASQDAVMGAEESGGYAWKGALPERDGILTSLLVMEMLADTKKSVSQLYKALEDKYGKSFFMRRDIAPSKPIPDKLQFAEKIKKKLTKNLAGRAIAFASVIDGIKVVLDNGWWVLLRPSGTEPLLRAYAETDDPEKTVKLLEAAQGWIQKLV
jgi:phosphomannomutase